MILRILGLLFILVFGVAGLGVLLLNLEGEI